MLNITLSEQRHTSVSPGLPGVIFINGFMRNKGILTKRSILRGKIMKERINLLKILKIAAGSTAAMVLGNWLGLNYSASAGVIALLSIHDTRRETLRATGNRIAGFSIALLLAPACFFFAGFRPGAIGLFLLLFTPLSMALRIPEAISVSTVLLTHFLTEGKMGGTEILNEILLLLTGTGTGMLLNLYMPGKKQSIQKKQRQIEEGFRELLREAAGALEKGQAKEIGFEEKLENLKNMILQGEKEAFWDVENSLLSETRYYLRYMSMRKSQLMVSEHMGECLKHLERYDRLPVQAVRIGELLEFTRATFHECNNAKGLLAKLEQTQEKIKGQSLPETRDEFEIRALLYQILLDLRQFLILKRDFAHSLTKEEKKIFWNESI